MKLPLLAALLFVALPAGAASVEGQTERCVHWCKERNLRYRGWERVGTDEHACMCSGESKAPPVEVIDSSDNSTRSFLSIDRIRNAATGVLYDCILFYGGLWCERAKEPQP